MQKSNFKDVDIKIPDPELMDEDNPEWTEEDIAKALRFSALPVELQELLSSPKHVVPDSESKSKRVPAA